MDGSVLEISHLNVRRVLLVCATTLAMGLLLSPTATYAQSAELMDAYERYSELHAQGRYREALPFAEEALRLGEGEFGTGLIPGNLLIAEDCKRASGIPDLFDIIAVRHKSGGKSIINLKSYDQGREAFEGTGRHWVWEDEEADVTSW